MSPTIPLSISLCEDLLKALTNQYLRLQASELFKSMILAGYQPEKSQLLPSWQKAVQEGHTEDSFKTWVSQYQTKLSWLVDSSLFKNPSHYATMEGLLLEGKFTPYQWVDLILSFEEIMSLPPGKAMTMTVGRGHQLEINKNSADLSTLEKKMIMEAHAGFKLNRSNGGPHGTYWIATFCPEFAALNYDDVNYDHDSNSLIENLYQQWEKLNANAS